MRVSAVYARFFRSLNYDYLRKTRVGYQPEPWDLAPDGDDYPFLRLRIDPAITAVVGANESGKSQLLAAIQKALSGDGIDRQDFCRYSGFFSQDESLTVPEFGLMLAQLGPADREAIAEASELDDVDIGTEVALFRMNATPKLRLYTLEGGVWVPHPVRKPTALQKRLPRVFEIDADIPLPDYVPIDYLASGQVKAAKNWERTRKTLSRIRSNFGWFDSAETVKAAAPELADAAKAEAELGPDAIRSFELADDLLVSVARVDRALFVELRSALDDGRNGYASALIETINRELASALNFPHWWSQDSDFNLLVEPRQDVLTFKIRDRTGTSYSFGERSAGLKYFLSYFVQYKSHEPADGPELLLMDEPDTYLSASGQQDLLRIFDGFADPVDDSLPIQVVYVTHSPFLIDRNHAERVRVLEKGEYEEGTRLVANASRNHYEPLRSSLGAFVGETTFIGACNLMVEGVSDQILIAGMSSRLTRIGAPGPQRLDLNSLSIVPAGGAPQIPYLVYLARGRDVDRPPLIVLMDGDKEGAKVRKVLQEGGPREQVLIDPELVMLLDDEQLDDLTSSSPHGVKEMEDLIPLPILVRAAQLYGAEFAPERDLARFDPALDEVFQGGGWERTMASRLRCDSISATRSSRSTRSGLPETSSRRPIPLSSPRKPRRWTATSVGCSQRSRACSARPTGKLRKRRSLRESTALGGFSSRATQSAPARRK